MKYVVVENSINLKEIVSKDDSENRLTSHLGSHIVSPHRW